MRAHVFKFIGLITLTVVAFCCGILLTKNNARDISVVFIPHHDLVAEERLEFLKSIQSNLQHKRFIVLSTNHYDAGEAFIQTRQTDFTTRNGIITIDRQLHSLALEQGAQDEPITFEAEHGISSLLPDIAELFPESQVLPLIVKPNIDSKKLDKTLSELKQACTDCILIASADFSHYQPYQLSEFHDKQTLRTLNTFALQDALQQKNEVGEPHVLWAAMRWAEMSGAKKFQLVNHTNSTEIIKDLDAEGTTHLFGYYETGEPQQTKASVSFSFSGKIDFAHNPSIEQFQTLGERVFWGVDLTAAEVSHTNGRSQRLLDYLHINTPLDTPATPIDHSLADGPLNNEPRTIVGNHATLLLYDFSPQQSTEWIPAAKNCVVNCFEIVYVRWPSDSTEERNAYSARQLIDKGADLVIGDGTTLKSVEVYKNRPIVYGLGSVLPADNLPVTSMTLSGEFTEHTITLLPMLIDSSSGKPLLQRTEASRDILKVHFEALIDQLQDDRGGLLFSITMK